MSLFYRGRFVLAAAIAGTLLFGAAAESRATTVTATMTVDNAFNFYVSQDDSVAGTLVFSGNSWPTTYSGGIALTPGVVNYLHVEATGGGDPEAFIGQFDLSDTDFHFANASQQLLSNTAHWQQSATGFGGNYSTPVSSGANGVGPWGPFVAINASAEWLAFPNASTSYFSAQIIPETAVVPEPATAALLAAGAFGLLASRKRRR